MDQRLNPEKKRKKKIRIKTDNQGLLIRKQNEKRRKKKREK